MSELPYETSEAFRSALAARFKAEATKTGLTVNELRRQFTYDRFLARLFKHDPEAWVLKGGGLLLARYPTKARHSLDIDLYYQTKAVDIVESVRAVFDVDDNFGDYFTFNIPNGRPTQSGTNVAVVAYVGSTEFERFRIDISTIANMTQPPETIPPIAPIRVDGLVQVNYQAYSVVDHIADKHAAMLETHRGVSSNRYRDLLDLVILANTATIRADHLRRALFSEYENRKQQPPSSVELPSEDWVAGYETLARNQRNLAEKDCQQALTRAQSLINPILQGQTTGIWTPDAGWTPPEP